MTINNSTIKKIVFLICFLVFDFAFIFYNVSVRKYNSLSYLISYESKIFSGLLFPQGFSFFTKDPMDEFYTLYQVEGDSLVLFDIRNANYDNRFGLGVRNSLINMQLGSLVKEIPTDAWCQYEYFSDTDNTDQLSLTNIALQKYLCGDYFVFKERPIPWGYYRNNPKKRKKSEKIEFVSIKSICEN